MGLILVQFGSHLYSCHIFIKFKLESSDFLRNKKNLKKSSNVKTMRNFISNYMCFSKSPNFNNVSLILDKKAADHQILPRILVEILLREF